MWKSGRLDTIPVQRLKVVQVGLGVWGRDWAWRINPSVADVEVVGYVDPEPAAFAQLQRELDVDAERCFSSLKAAVDTTAPDAALVTTTLPAHEPLTRAALEAGLHVLVEKPFTDSLETAKDLVHLAADRGRTLMVSQNYRWFPASRTAAALTREGSLGELYAISIDFRRNSASPPHPRRRHHSDTQPLLFDMSVHHFDLLRMVVGAEPDSIFCTAPPMPWTGFDGPPAAFATIRFDRVAVSYRASWVSAAPITAWAGEWNMEFERGSVAWTSRGDEGILNDRVTVRPRRGRAKHLMLPELGAVDRAGTLTEFATAIREGREPETSGRDNVATLAFMVAAAESAARNESVAVAGDPPPRLNRL